MDDRESGKASSRRRRRRERDLARLLVLASRGDVEAFMRFYDATVDPVYLLARSCRAGGADTDDIVLAVFERAWRTAPEQARSDLSPVAWLLRDVGAASTSVDLSRFVRG